MFGRSVKLFRIFGFEVKIDLSWLIIFVLVVWSLAGGVFPKEFEKQQLAWPSLWGMAVIAAVVLFGSVIFHELCHSLVARRYGLAMRGITLFIFGGVSEMSEEPPNAKTEFLMAIAGPLSSMLLAGAFYGGYFLARAGGAPVEVTGVLRWLGLINLFLAGFNLIPGFPLDGGRVLRSIIWQVKGDLRRATAIAAGVGQVFGLVLIALGVVELLLLDAIGGLWLILIGFFVRAAARQAYQQVLIRQALHGEPVARFMSAEPVTVAPSLTLAELVEDYIYKYHFKMFPVVDAGRLVGCVTTRELRGIPRQQWNQRTVADVAHPCSDETTLSPGQDAMEALTLMNRNQASRLMVVQDGKLAGILSLKDLLKFLSLKLELESGRATGRSASQAPPPGP